MIGYLIGNGTSRLGFDLNRLNGRGVTVGCNWIYRDYNPNYVVSLDSGILLHIAAKKNKEGGLPFTWLWRNLKTLWLHMDNKMLIHCTKINGNWYNNSGLVGAWFLSNHLRCETVYMIGMDFFRPRESKINDCYNDAYYGSPDLHKGFERLMNDNKQTEFIRIGEIIDSDKEFYKNNLTRLAHREVL